ncbi:lytic polysaccharide monooxygenase [Micromonospora sp. DT44]|uniref:lytic polysaccharide monooxygenase n=1 Tax=Micromonospora sp. DT44 TaxID=3393439 RepID=UPI003CF47BF4
MRSTNSDQSGGRPRSTVRRSLQALILLFAMVAGALPSVGAAQAHGTVINPATRAYQCWKTWGNQHTNPAMQQQDPMCYRAFQANPDTMWNWMSQLRDGLGGQFQARTPDGQLCSNALSRNDSLNHPRTALALLVGLRGLRTPTPVASTGVVYDLRVMGMLRR